jgi:hypothetical protein
VSSAPLAHAGHWIEGAVFAAPVVVLVGLLWVDARRQRRRAARGDVTESHR